MSDDLEDEIIGAMPEGVGSRLSAATRLQLVEAVRRAREQLGDDHRIDEADLLIFSQAMWAWFEAGWQAGAVDAVAQAIEQGANLQIEGPEQLEP